MSSANPRAVVIVATTGLIILADREERLDAQVIPWAGAAPDSIESINDCVKRTLDPAICETLPKSGVQLWIDDFWLSWAVVPWSRGAWLPRSMEAQCRIFLSAGANDSSESLYCAWEDAGWAEPRISVGVSATLVDRLVEIFESIGSRVASVVPLSAGLWNGLGPKVGSYPSVLVATFPDHVIFIRGRNDLREAVVVVSRGADRVASDVLLGRLGYRDPLWAIASEHFQIAFGDHDEGKVAEATERTLADLSQACLNRAVSDPLCLWHRTSAVSGWRGIALGIGLLVLALSLGAYSTVSRRLDEQMRRQVSQNQAEERARQAPVSHISEATISSANQAVRQLNVPVVPLLKALRPPKDIPVFLLGLDLADSAKGSNSIRVMAEANNGYDMANYVGYLGTSLPFSSAWLVHHEESTPEKGGHQGIRFVVEAQWQD